MGRGKRPADLVSDRQGLIDGEGSIVEKSFETNYPPDLLPNGLAQSVTRHDLKLAKPLKARDYSRRGKTTFPGLCDVC